MSVWIVFAEEESAVLRLLCGLRCGENILSGVGVEVFRKRGRPRPSLTKSGNLRRLQAMGVRGLRLIIEGRDSQFELFVFVVLQMPHGGKSEI